MSWLSRLLKQDSRVVRQAVEWSPPEGEYLQRWTSCVEFPRFSDRQTEVFDLNGIDWFEAPIPPTVHRCYVQSYAYVDWFNLVERCACGAICMHRGSHIWLERNSRTAQTTEPPPERHDQ